MLQLSIIMPLYNEEKNLSHGIESFLSQSISSDCELICIDDGSSDSTVNLIERYSHMGNIRLLKQHHQGSGEARNLGIKAAKGIYIGFLDADDEYPSPYTLEHLISAANETDESIVGGSLESVYVHEDGTESKANVSRLYIFPRNEKIMYEDYQVDFAYQRFIFSAQLIRSHNIEFPRLVRYQDPPFFVRCMIASQSFFALKEPTYHYRLDKGKVSWNFDKISDLLDGLIEVATLASENNLRNLFHLTQSRLVDYWKSVILPYSLDFGDFEVIEKALCAHGKMCKLASQMKPPATKSPFSIELSNNVRAILDNSNLQESLQATSKKLEKADEALDKIKRSNSWKIGRAFTAAPRAIKRFLRESSR